MRLNEMVAQLAHIEVVVDDHEAAHGVLREPGCDLLSPVGAGRAGRGLVENEAGEPLHLQDLLKLGDGFTVPPGGRDDDIGSAARHDLVQHLNARTVQIPVPIPPADRGQHTVDVEKDYPSCQFLDDDLSDSMSSIACARSSTLRVVPLEVIGKPST